jgi:hypothetical protein
MISVHGYRLGFVELDLVSIKAWMPFTVCFGLGLCCISCFFDNQIMKKKKKKKHCCQNNTVPHNPCKYQVCLTYIVFAQFTVEGQKRGAGSCQT